MMQKYNPGKCKHRICNRVFSRNIQGSIFNTCLLLTLHLRNHFHEAEMCLCYVSYIVPQQWKSAGCWTLQWRHNGRDSISNHQPHDRLLSRLFRCRSKKTSKPRVTGLCAGNSLHKWPVTRKRFPFDNVIMKFFSEEDVENPSCAPVQNRVHPHDFVFQKSRAIARDFCGIQTHEGELHSARVPMIDFISSTMFASCDNFTKTSEIRNHSQIDGNNG